ncbi:MAG: phospholipid carrier-dependent glycosyltransferase, partial [Thaumarchaeota archaeon]|nr:phospholipid carrier-dependent glycosyltransferase [Nitrososphaerota archaeon]
MKSLPQRDGLNLKLKAIYFLIIVLALSSFTHLWNPTSFPEIFFDEGIYMRRAMNVINGDGPQEGKFYDHPYFGQIFLGSILYSMGYPDSLNPTRSADSIRELYEVPRILMGLLAVFDTFLIYKIANKRYDSKIAIFASSLFAVMPITWLTRRILLDSILLPFVLLSVLFAIYSKDSKQKNWLVLLSGIFLGLAIFTKIPAFTMILIVGYLVYSQSKRKRLLLVLLIPAVL